MPHLGDYFYLGVSMAALPPRDLFTTWCLVRSQSAGGKDEIRAIQSQQNTSDVRKDLATGTFSKRKALLEITTETLWILIPRLHLQ